MKFKLLYIFLVTALVACNKEGDSPTPSDGSSGITITIDSPNENATFDFGDQVSVSGDISALNTVHGYSVTLTNASNQDSVLFLDEVHSHDANVQFSNVWTNDLQDTSTVLLQIIAFGDHEGSISESLTRQIICNGQ